MFTPAKKIYDDLKQAIDDACANKTYNHVFGLADEYRFNKEDRSSGFELNYIYTRSTFDSGIIRLKFRSYDPTNTFEAVQPDVNRFKLEWFTLKEQHSNMYED